MPSWHATHEQTIDVRGDEATGEVYCAGRHLQKGGCAENQVMTMVIR